MRRRVVVQLVGSTHALAIAFLATSCGRIGYEAIDLDPQGPQHRDADVGGTGAGAGGSLFQGSAVTSTWPPTGTRHRTPA